MKNYFWVFSSFLVVTVFMSVFGSVSAGEDESAFGWAWSGSENSGGDDSGFGWISMNSINCDTDDDGQSDGAAGCPAAGTAIPSYGVHIPSTGELDQNLSGYAWSDNVGWISFNASDLSGCPQGTCTAYKDELTIRGWARIISIPSSPSNDGDFDGWIKLSSEIGDPVSYGLTLDESVIPRTLSGYAWSDEFGWIDFSRVFAGPVPDLVICPSASNIGVGGILQARVYADLNNNIASCANTSALVDITTDSFTEWSSGDPAVITVDNTTQKGLLTGASNGSSVITVAYKGIVVNAYFSVITGATTTCGDGVVDPGEGCDDGSSLNGGCGIGASCSPICTVNICACEL